MAATTATTPRRPLLCEHLPATALGAVVCCHPGDDLADAVDACTPPPPLHPSSRTPAARPTAPVPRPTVRRFTAEELAAAREAEERTLAPLEALAAVFRPRRARPPRDYGAGPVTLLSRVAATPPAAPSGAVGANAESTGADAVLLLPQHRDTANTITFAPTAAVPAVLAAPQTAPPYPEVPVCAITGARAKYREPLTGRPFRDMQSYKLLRRLVNMREEVTIDQRIVELSVALERRRAEYDRAVADLTRPPHPARATTPTHSHSQQQAQQAQKQQQQQKQQQAQQQPQQQPK